MHELLALTPCSLGEAFARCERALARRARSWRLLRLGVGADTRAELATLVLWHRVLHEAPPARRADLRAELERAIDGRPETPLGVALAGAIGRLALPPNLLRGPFLALDEDERRRTFATTAELARHAQRLTHPEGRLLLRALGTPRARGERQEVLADALATALLATRWTVRLREELENGRLRLPADALARHGLSPAALLDAPGSEPVRRALAEHVAWVRAQFAKGWPLCHALGLRPGLALAFVLRWHAASLSALEARGYALAAEPRAGALRALACGVASLSRRPPRLSRAG